MARKPWWVGLLGTLALIVIASGCGPPRPWGEEYPGPWQEDPSTEDFRAIVKALSVNDVRGCGEFHYRPSAHHSNEYLVYCTRDGKVWQGLAGLSGLATHYPGDRSTAACRGCSPAILVLNAGLMRASSLTGSCE